MRLKIILEPKNTIFKIPINYQYPLSSAVYNVFHNGSNKIAEWLHDTGFKGVDGKPRKLFNFSYLKFEHKKIYKNIIEASGIVEFLFSSPIETKLINTFVDGIFKESDFIIADKSYRAEFFIKTIEIIPEPAFSQEIIYNTLTPITVSNKQEMNGKLGIHYFRADEEGFDKAVTNNLRKKYESIFQNDSIDNLSVELIKSENAKSKLITIKEGTDQESKVKGFLTSVKIIGKPEIQKVAYYCGLGERNSIGFGMLEIIQENFF